MISVFLSVRHNIVNIKVRRQTIHKVTNKLKDLFLAHSIFKVLFGIKPPVVREIEVFWLQNDQLFEDVPECFVFLKLGIASLEKSLFFRRERVDGILADALMSEAVEPSFED